MSERIIQVIDEFDGYDELLISSFSGGDRGKGYQFTIGKNYVQVSKNTAQEIVIKLLTEMVIEVMDKHGKKENMP